jgi:GNAT superfamily N-acetyltransferase
MALKDTREGKGVPPRGCRPDEVARVAAAASAIFLHARYPGADMAAWYPLLFEPANAPRLRIVERDGRIASHAGFCVRDARLGDVRARVACFGAVFTTEARRGLGLATLVVEDAVAEARAAGAQIGLVSGWRGLYQRLGFSPAPPAVRHRGPPEGSVGGELSIVPATAAHVTALAALHGAEPIRFERSAGDWARLLAAGIVMMAPGTVLLVRRAGRPVAYAAVERRPRDGRVPVREVAGDRAAIVQALPALAAHVGAPIDLVGPAHDDALAAAARAAGLPREHDRLAFGAAVWDRALASAPLPWYGLNFV